MGIQNKTTQAAASGQGDQGKPDGNKSLEDIALDHLEEVDDDEDDDGGSDDDGEPDNDDDDGEGDQTDKDGEGGDADPPKKKFMGRFDTVEEMEAYAIGLEAAKKETPTPSKKPDEKAVPDLTESELITFAEQDEADKTNYLEGYLRQKMKERVLQPHELAAVRRIDTEKGSDLYGDYLEARAARSAQRETAPLAKRAQDEQAKAFQAAEAAIDATNATEFGDELPGLEKFTSDPKNVEKILQSSPVARIILNEHEKGSPATAHKLLLREAAAMIRQTKRDKSKRSVTADAGSGAPRKPAAKTAATIEEAVEQFDAENDQ